MMSAKRPTIMNLELSSDGPPTKKARKDFSRHQDTTSSLALPQLRTTDPTYGQSYAFPGLEDGDEDDEIFYGPAEDGLEYLRMVRWVVILRFPARRLRRPFPRNHHKLRLPSAAGGAVAYRPQNMTLEKLEVWNTHSTRGLK